MDKESNLNRFFQKSLHPQDEEKKARIKESNLDCFSKK